MLAEIGRRIFGYEHQFVPLRRFYHSLRLWYVKTFRYQLLSVGKGVIIGRGTHIRPHCASIGDYSFIGENCWLEANVDIGRFVLIAGNVSIIGGDHRFDVPGVPSIRTGRAEMKQVTIEDDVWIGRGATIIHGITIGEGAIIAAGALVTKSVEPYMIVGSPPARPIRPRFADQESIDQHRAMLVELRRGGQDFQKPH